MSENVEAACPEIRVMMMPRDTNAAGTIFGGVILSYIDQAGALAAMHVAAQRFVTVAMDSIEFKQPVFVGDVLSLYATVERMGTSSVTVRVRVDAERWDRSQTVRVTEARAVYVAVDEQRRKVALKQSQDGSVE